MSGWRADVRNAAVLHREDGLREPLGFVGGVRDVEDGNARDFGNALEVAEKLGLALLVDCGAASSEAPAEEQVLANGEVRKEPVGLEDEADAARFDGKVDARSSDLKTRPLTLIVPDAGFTRSAMLPVSVDLPQLCQEKRVEGWMKTGRSEPPLRQAFWARAASISMTPSRTPAASA